MSDVILEDALTLGRYDDINLERLPAPEVIEQISFETIRGEMIAALGAPYTTLPLSDPMIKLIEVAAAREVKLRARCNDAAKAVMLAFSRGNNLEHLGALYGVARQVIQEADPTAYPPIEEIKEQDSPFRYRIQLAPEGFSVAGPHGAYEFHALKSVPGLRSVAAVGPEEHNGLGVVKVYILPDEHGLVPDQDTLDQVLAALNAEEVRPLTDFVEVYPAEIVEYQIKAKIYTYPGPDPTVVETAANTAINAYVEDRYRLGHDITLS